MNIAHILPYAAKFPRKTHHGRYDWAWRLAHLQAQAGHIVTMYCGPSTTDETLKFQTVPYSLGNALANNISLFELAFANSEHEVYHSHFDSLHYNMAQATTKPIIYTQHWFPNQIVATAAHQYPASNVLAVPVTQYMANVDRDLQIPASSVIRHGIDLQLFAPNYAPHGDRLLFVGRITEQKGIEQALQLAIHNNAKLDIVGKVITKDQNYWKHLQPLIDGERICYLGPQSRPAIAKLLQQAQAFVFMPQSAEAFGQTMIEAQACGTPVITNPLGAANQLLQPGATGYVVTNAVDFGHAIANLNTINQQQCRRFAELYDQNSMVLAYEQLYRSLI